MSFFFFFFKHFRLLLTGFHSLITLSLCYACACGKPTISLKYSVICIELKKCQRWFWIAINILFDIFLVILLSWVDLWKCRGRTLCHSANIFCSICLSCVIMTTIKTAFKFYIKVFKSGHYIRMTPYFIGTTKKLESAFTYHQKDVNLQEVRNISALYSRLKIKNLFPRDQCNNNDPILVGIARI